jgi:O-antigen/teichoic acid export membrane protein
MRRYLPDALLVGVLFLLPLLMFWPQTLGGRTLLPTENLYQYEPYVTYREVVRAPSVPHNHLLSDLVLQNYPWKQFLRDQIAIGEIPLWNPHQFAGIPFLAAGQHSGLYPLSVLYYILDLPAAYGWFTVVNLGLAGAFMMGLARALGASRVAGLIAGIVYQLGGFMIASAVFPMMIGGVVWLPLLLWMIERVVRGQRALWALIVGAGAVGLNVLAGHAEITIYTLFIAGWYAAGRLLMESLARRDARWLIQTGGLLLAMVALGLGLGAVQLIPLYDFVRVNWRADRASLETVLSYAHPPRDVLQFLMPNIYGSPAHHTIFDWFSGQWVTLDGNPSFHTEWGIKNYVEGALYLGLLPLVLALAAFGGARRGLQAIFGSLGALALSFMFGLPTYALIYALPGINQLNSPFRWIYALTVCVAILAALGFDRLAGQNGRWAKRVAYGMAALGAVVIVALGAARLAYPALADLVERAFRSLTNADRAFPNAELFFSYSAGQALIFALALALSGLALRWLVSRWRTAWAGVAVSVVIAVDLMAASWSFNPASDPALLDFVPPSVQFLQAQGQARFLTLDDPSQPPNLQANSAWRHGLYDLRGYDSIIPRPTVDYLRGLAPQVQLDFNRVAPLFTRYADFDVWDALSSPRLRSLNVQFIVTQTRSEEAQALMQRDPERFVAVYSDPAQTIYRVTDALPRYLVCCESPALNARLASSDALAAAELDALTPSGTATLRSDTARERLLDVSALTDGWLIVSEAYAEGWRAFLRPIGAPESAETLVPVQTVNGLFQGVPISAGVWTLRMVYSPTSFQVGVFGTAISAALVTLLIGMSVWRAVVGREAARSTTARVARNSVAPIVLNLFNKGIDFAFLLVMLRVLTPQEVGTYYYLVVVFVWFDIFTNFGLDLYLIRAVSRDKAQSGRLLYNTTLLRLALAVIGVGLVMGFVAIRQATVTPPLDETALLALALLYAGLFPASLSKGISSLFYAHEQVEKPAAIATITTINKVVFGVIVLLAGAGIVGLAAVSVVNNLLTLAILAYTGRALVGRLATWRPELPLMLRMIRDSWALLLNHFLATIFFQVDVIILEALKGAELVARYSIAYRWLNAINIVPSFFTQALLPVMSRQATDDPAALRRTYTFGVKLMFTLAVPMAAGFTLLAVPLTEFIGGAQYLPEGAGALVLMIWSIPIGWMNSLTQYALVALDMQRHILRAFIAAVIFNIGTNLLLIPEYGYIAAAITTIASELVLFIPFGLLMERGLGGRIAWGELLWRPALAGGAMLLVGFGLMPLSPWLGALVGAGVYGVVLIALRPLDESERALFAKLLPGRARPLAARVGLA